jgi:hypothetical protein
MLSSAGQADHLGVHANRSTYDWILKEKIVSNHFYDKFRTDASLELQQKQQRQLAQVLSDAPTYIHTITREHKHCVFTQDGEGLQFYYAIMALHVAMHVEYDGRKDEFLTIIHAAGHRALEALDKLINIRAFKKVVDSDGIGLLVCLFYALMTMMRLRNRIVSHHCIALLTSRSKPVFAMCHSKSIRR